MNTKVPLQYAIYLAVVAGVVLTLGAAVVPHYGHHKLMFSVLAVGALPYLAFFIATRIVTHAQRTVAGLAILGVDMAVKLAERFVAFDHYASGLIYAVPLIATVAIAAAYLYRRPGRVVQAGEPSDPLQNNSAEG